MPDRETRTILIVDNSASMLFYLAMLLKRLEYKVLTARNAEDALRMVEAAAPSLVLTELSLPGMNGLELLKHLKNQASFRAIPVVILASDNEPGMKDACAGLGCASFLAKPVEPEELYRAIQSVSEAVPRSHIRLGTSLQVFVGDNGVTGGALRPEYATAISEGGLYIRTLQPQPRNALLPLRLLLGGSEIRTRAVVLYTCVLGEGPFTEPGMGVKFVELSDADRARIRAFIREHLTGDLVPHLQATAPETGQPGRGV
jgi:CheY-like chemotaxis protein